MCKKIKKLGKNVTKIFGLLFCVCLLTSFFVPVEEMTVVHATEVDEIDGSGMLDSEGGDDFNLSISTNEGSGSLSGALKIVLVLTVLSLAPSILIMMTSFTRILIVLHFTRSALGTQTTPPNQILIGLSLFLTLFIKALKTRVPSSLPRLFSATATPVISDISSVIKPQTATPFSLAAYSAAK